MATSVLDGASIPQLADNGVIDKQLASILGQYVTGPGGLKDAATAKGLYMYYRQPNGDITLSPCFMTDMLRYMMEGWTPLPKYGKFRLNDWYHEHMYEVLLQKGGEAEFTKDQATELRFGFPPNPEPGHGHIVPGCGLILGQRESFDFQEKRGRDELDPKREHRHDSTCYGEEGWDPTFPQFTGEEKSFACQFCGDNHVSKKALDSHVSVMHQSQIAAHSTALALADAIKSANKN